MRVVVVAIVVAGIAFALALTINGKVSTASVVTLVFLLAAGAFALGVARRSTSSSVGPAVCHECGGVISPHAPSCKHCGVAVSR